MTKFKKAIKYAYKHGDVIFWSFIGIACVLAECNGWH
jgi:hypothetical protein